MDVTELNARIAAGDTGMLDTLRALDDACIADDSLTSPMAAAIRAGNQAALDALLTHETALEYVPQLDREVDVLPGSTNWG